MKHFKKTVFVIALASFCFCCKTTTIKNEETKSVPQNSSLNLEALIPTDTSIRKGVLKNGMTYYLHATDVKKDVASYYIIQNVGSVLENENQRGLAHFLEHMAFNGTQFFPGKGILDTMEKKGLVFGRDINAYTSFDETVYNINNIPTEPEMIDTGLQVLHDWSNYLLLTDKEIDAERGVIKEEWRSGQNGGRRVQEATLGTQFGHSKYENRLPIGLIPLVESFDYKVLRDFYHDWYRTDLQAIAIVGDIDVDALEAKIKAKFSKIPKIENAPERYNIEIKDNTKLDFVMATDKEVSASQITFNIRDKASLENQTIADFREQLLNIIISEIINNRFNQLSQNINTPFRDAGIGYSQLSRLHNNFSLQVTPKANMQKEAFALAFKELNRAVKFGVTNSELKRLILEFDNYLESQLNRIGDRSHGDIIGLIQQNYLQNKTIVDVKKEVSLTRQLLKNVTTQDVLNRIQELYTQKNRNVALVGVEGNKNLTKNQVLDIINSVENSTDLKPYKEEKEITSLLDKDLLKAGKITSEIKNKDLDFVTYTLSNGIKVHYKFVNKTKDNVSLSAISKGGTSLLPIADLPSAKSLPTLARLSGLGDFSATDLQKALGGKTASSYVSLGSLSESVSGQSSTKDVETMLQLVHLHFTKPKLTQEGFALVIDNIKNYKIIKSSDLGAKMSDSIKTTLYGKNNSRYRLLDDQYISDIKLDKIKKIYKERFANPADFNFFIIGDVASNAIKPLLETYIASLPTTDKKEHWKAITTPWVKPIIDKDFFMPMEDAKSTVNIEVRKDLPYNLKNKFVIAALGNILSLRYIESLREEEGGTYGANAYAYLNKDPKSYGSIVISFDCNPDLTEKLISIVYKEINKLKNGSVLQSDLDKIKTSMLKDRNDSKNDNYYDARLIKTFVEDGYNIEAPENFENIINAMSIKDIQDMANKFLTDNTSYEIVFKPKK